MKRFLLIYSGWISLLILVLFNGAKAQEKVTYKATVTFHGQELSGRMMFKQVSRDTVRYAFFNELGMSFVMGTLSVSSQQSAVSSQIENIASFLDYKQFRKNFEKAIVYLLAPKGKLEYGMIENPKEMVYKNGKKFSFKVRF